MGWTGDCYPLTADNRNSVTVILWLQLPLTEKCCHRDWVQVFTTNKIPMSCIWGARD